MIKISQERLKEEERLRKVSPSAFSRLSRRIAEAGGKFDSVDANLIFLDVKVEMWRLWKFGEPLREERESLFGTWRGCLCGHGCPLSDCSGISLWCNLRQQNTTWRLRLVEVQIGSEVFHFLEITWFKMSAGHGLC